VVELPLRLRRPGRVGAQGPAERVLDGKRDGDQPQDHRQEFAHAHGLRLVYAFGCCSASASFRLSRIFPLRSTETTFTSTSSPSLSTSSTFLTRELARSLMCTSPSVPGKISTNAPNSMMRRTVPR